VWTGGNENGYQYDWNGKPIGFSPIMGAPPGLNIGKPLSLLKLLRNTRGLFKTAKEGTKLLNQFNSSESLIHGAGNLTKVKAGMQGFVKGDGAAIFKAISQGGTRQANGTILMKDGTTLFNHFSTKTGVYTIDINKAGQIYKIRVTP